MNIVQNKQIWKKVTAPKKKYSELKRIIRRLLRNDQREHKKITTGNVILRLMTGNLE